MPGVSDTTASSARLALLRLDLQGRLTAPPGLALAPPLDSVPTLEVGPFVPAPRERVGMDRDWQVSDGSRPLRDWHLAGIDQVNGTSCLKLVGSQQSDDWDRPRADHTAWKRQDTVWLAARQGYAVRVERLIELREPARLQPTQRGILRYDLESSLSYPGTLQENRRQEITQAQAFADSAAPLLQRPQQYGQQINLLLSKISNHLESQAATPYRDALLQVRRRLEAAPRRGAADRRA